MAQAPLNVKSRPFAIEPVTNVMLPDGIFDNAIYQLKIACHVTNDGPAPLNDARIYIESVGDPGIGFTPRTFYFATIKPGATVLISWLANFEFARPGKTYVSIVATADGMEPRRSLRQIFVTETRYDSTSKKWTCVLPEGRLEVFNIYAMKSGADWCGCGGDDKDPREAKRHCPPFDGPRPITGIRFAWVPNPPFAGQHGDLPFSDPWWKIVGIVVAIIAAIVGIIAAALGAGTFNPGVKGKFDETGTADPPVQCCTPDPQGGFKNNATTVAGVAATICSVGIAVACSDDADPVWRGQENTQPQAGELTVAEEVEAHWDYLDPPNAGVPYKTKVKWRYRRITTGASYDYEVEEEQTNIHVAENVTVETPATVQFPEPMWVKSRFDRPGGAPFVGPDLYAFALFRSPADRYFVTGLGDDGVFGDSDPSDGSYYGFLDSRLVFRELTKFGEEPYGLWRVYVYAQDVNLVPPGTDPVQAAKTVGGSFVASALTIEFDPSLPCPLKAQGSFTVV